MERIFLKITYMGENRPKNHMTGMLFRHEIDLKYPSRPVKNCGHQFRLLVE